MRQGRSINLKLLSALTFARPKVLPRCPPTLSPQIVHSIFDFPPFIQDIHRSMRLRDRVAVLAPTQSWHFPQTTVVYVGGRVVVGSR